MKTLIGFLMLAAPVLLQTVTAAEYHGTVKCGGLPFPGVTVTASQEQNKVVTTTDARGVFRFADLADGPWTIEVQMLGFETISKPVSIVPGAPEPAFELTFVAPPATTDVTPTRQTRTANPAAQFQQLSVNASSESPATGTETSPTAEQLTTLNQNAANSFIVQGSVSSALQLGQTNDWGPPGVGQPGMGMGQARMAPAGAAVGGDDRGPSSAAAQGGRGAMSAAAGDMGGGPPPGGGPGGPGGGPPPGGGPGGGGPGGGGPGGGGPGGGGPGGGGAGGPGGPDGGPMARGGWQGRPNAIAFGNARRNPQNMYMGNLSFTLGNSVLDARSFSVTGADVDKPAYGSARGSLMLGGPLQIPKLVSASRRIFFSFNYQVQRSRSGTVSDALNVPTALERTGDFSQTSVNGSAVTIYDPTNGTPFPGNRIPSGRISAAALSLLNFYPLPNLTTSGRDYQTSWVNVNNSQNINARISNVRFGTKDRLNFGFGYQDGSSVSPNLFQFVDTGASRGLNTSLGWSHTIDTHLTDTVQIAFSRMRQLTDPYFASRENVAAADGIAGTSQESLNWGPPNLSFTNYAGLSDGNYSLNRNQTSSIADTLLWVHGSHNLTFGGDYRSQKFDQLGDTNGRGSFSFDGSMTSLQVNGVTQSGTGYDLADFLLGAPTTASLRYGNFDRYLRGSGYDFYINDDWRVSSRFSLILGLRYEYSAPVTELYNRLVNLAIAPDYSTISVALAGKDGYSAALIHPDRDNFSPRLGFAWRPLTKGSLVVRGGYGVYYNTSVYNVIAGNLAQQPPFAESLSISGSSTSPLNIANALTLATTQGTTSTYAVDPNYRLGYAQSWSLTVQHDLPGSLFATVGYLGTKGTRLDQQFIPNSAAPGAAESTLVHDFTYETSNGDSVYHAAQFQLMRRFHSGIMAHASYQFSKSIDDAGTGGRGQGNTPVAQNWLDLSAERALSSFDQRHNLSLQLQYSTGMGTTGGTLLNGWKSALLKHWTVSSDVNLHSGNPFTATVGGSGSQVSGTAVSNTLRADATGELVEIAGALFNTAAFTLPASGSWGNAGRNTIPGPTTFSLNSSLGRVFSFGDRRSADLQLQAQNVLNHVTITNWGTVVDSSTYGLATNAASMRKITLSLRFRF
jgi:hypothetical protein